MKAIFTTGAAMAALLTSAAVNLVHANEEISFDLVPSG